MTEQSGVAHDVAPDFRPPRHSNTLAARPQYRLALRLGNFDALFPHPGNSVEGRMERLQALGLFYFPLQHAKAREAYGVAWPYVKEKLFGLSRDPKSDNDADGKIRNGLATRIVGEARVLFSAPASGQGGLPPPAADPEKPLEENFAKIRLPGGYTFLKNPKQGLNLNHDAKYGERFTGLASLHEAEKTLYLENRALGRIPLIARVERRAGEKEWVPVHGATVRLELASPYTLPSLDPKRPVLSQFAAPPAGASDEQIAILEKASGRAQEPEFGKELKDRARLFRSGRDFARGAVAEAEGPSGNCPKESGGKRGHPAAGGDPRMGVFENVFYTGSTPGFNESHDGKPPLDAPYSVPTPGPGDSALAQTNGNGEAGFIFMPSRAGGDRYRLRAVLQLPGVAESEAPRVETGTLVVWRNIRISRYAEQGPNPQGRVAAFLMNQVRSLSLDWNEKIYWLQAGVSLQAPGMPAELDGLGSVAWSDPQDAALLFDGPVREFARAFCEVEVDSPTGPERLNQPEWTRAVKQAIEDAKTGMKWAKENLNLPCLFCWDLIEQEKIKVDDAAVHFPMRLPREYNHALAAGLPGRPLNVDPNGKLLRKDGILIPDLLT